MAPWTFLFQAFVQVLLCRWNRLIENVANIMDFVGTAFQRRRLILACVYVRCFIDFFGFIDFIGLIWFHRCLISSDRGLIRSRFGLASVLYIKVCHCMSLFWNCRAQHSSDHVVRRFLAYSTSIPSRFLPDSVPIPHRFRNSLFQKLKGSNRGF